MWLRFAGVPLKSVQMAACMERTSTTRWAASSHAISLPRRHSFLHNISFLTLNSFALRFTFFFHCLCPSTPTIYLNLQYLLHRLYVHSPTASESYLCASSQPYNCMHLLYYISECCSPFVEILSGLGNISAAALSLGELLENYGSDACGALSDSLLPTNNRYMHYLLSWGALSQ